MANGLIRPGSRGKRPTVLKPSNSERQQPEKKKASRPLLFTKELVDQICDQLASGVTLREVCRAEVMPDERTVRRWALEDREGFAERYAQAREIGYQSMADEMLEIADDGSNDWMLRKDGDKEFYVLNREHVQRSRLRLDTRKWLLSKALPKVYGDKLAIASNAERPVVLRVMNIPTDDVEELKKLEEEENQ
jgi:hypothetical protein